MAPPTVNRGPAARSVRIALTGATGFLGAHIARCACDADLSVRAVVRNPDRLRDGNVPCAEAVTAELDNNGALLDAFAGVDVVVANAALGSHSGTLDDYIRINERGVENTVRAAAGAGVRRVVLISTVAVMPTQPWSVIANDTPMRDVAASFDWSRFSTDPRYSHTKTRGERLARELATALGIELVILRPGPIWGSGDTRFTARMVRALQRPVRLVPTVGVPLVYAPDVATAVVAATVRDGVAGNAYTLAGPPLPLSRFARELGRAAGTRSLVVPIPVPLAVRYEIAPAERDLGFRNRELAGALEDFLSRTDPF